MVANGFSPLLIFMSQNGGGGGGGGGRHLPLCETASTVFGELQVIPALEESHCSKFPTPFSSYVYNSYG